MTEAITSPGGTERKLWRGKDDQLWAQGARGPTPVRVVRCFPWSEPGRYLSLRDPDDEEVALVRDATELAPEERALLADALREVGFVFEIESIHAVEEEIEIRTFRVQTQQGPRRFQTLRDEWPRDLPSGGLLIRDVVGDLYVVRDLRELDAKSRQRLFAFVD